MIKTTLEKGHPGNRVWIADCGDEWSLLVAARDRHQARILAFDRCCEYSLADPSEVLMDLRLHLYRRRDGSVVTTEYVGACDGVEDDHLLGFDADEDATWLIEEGKPAYEW